MSSGVEIEFVLDEAKLDGPTYQVRTAACYGATQPPAQTCWFALSKAIAVCPGLGVAPASSVCTPVECNTKLS